MANSMEARPAFLDHPLVEFAVTLPPNLRLRDRQDKYILRETMRPLLPETLYRRQTFAFMAPPAHTDPVKQRAMANLADTYLSREPIAAAGLLDDEAVNTLRLRHQNGHTPVTERVQLDAVLKPPAQRTDFSPALCGPGSHPSGPGPSSRNWLDNPAASSV